MSSTPVPIPQDAIRLLLGAQLRRRFTAFAAASVVIYDHLVTIDQEKKYIWDKPWTLLSYLYVTSRYSGDLLVIFSVFEATRHDFSKHLCINELNYSTWSWWGLGLISQFILQLRVWALFHRSKKIIATCLALWVVQIVLSIRNQFHVTNSAIPLPFRLSSDSHYCWFKNLTSNLSWWMLPWVAFDTFLFGLAIFVFSRNIRNLIRDKQWNQRLLLVLIFRDSLIYFALSIAMYMACLIVGLINPVETGVPLEIMLGGHVVIATRLTLGLRRLFYSNMPGFTTEWGDPEQEGQNARPKQELVFKRSTTNTMAESTTAISEA